MVLYRKIHASYFESFKEELTQGYDKKDLGPLNWFLGIEVIRDRIMRQVYLCQRSYITKIALRFGCTNIQPPKQPLPAEPLTANDLQATASEVQQYQALIDSILYACIITRADFLLAVTKLSQHLTNPSNLANLGPRH